jgi:hypothetical protein
MMKKLENLRWSPKWVSHLGCVKGCLDYLGIEMTDAWLYGGTSHAFVLNISDVICPSGPTAWKTMILFKGGNNLGYEFDASFGWKEGNENFAELQESTWEFTKNAIDEGVPIYGWELEIPEFYVIYGYDDVGYYYSGPMADEGKGPKPWSELGKSEIGLIEIYSVKEGTSRDDTSIVKSAFENALKHASNPEAWKFVDRYASGLKGYDLWIKALETGRADRFGMGYNIEVWRECRHYAVDFLKEAKERLNGKAESLFDDALAQYQVVAERLAQVAELYPFLPSGSSEAAGEIEKDENSRVAVDLLKQAWEAEEDGLGVLEKIVEEL